MVSRMYHDGVGTRIDYLQARMWAEKGAEQGEIDAISLLGVMKYRGEGGNKDVREAKKLAEKGADAGNAKGYVALEHNVFLWGRRGARSYKGSGICGESSLFRMQVGRETAQKD